VACIIYTEALYRGFSAHTGSGGGGLGADLKAVETSHVAVFLLNL